MTLIEVVRGDLTRDDSDAIVNAANSALLGGGGVDGAIHRAAGPALLEACREVRQTSHPAGLPAGQAVVTIAGDLPATWVIHTVGPQHWEHPDGGVELLKACHTSSLDAAADVGARSIAFPAISCGVYGWAAQNAAPVAMAAVREWTNDHPDAIDRIRFVLFNEEVYTAFEEAR